MRKAQIWVSAVLYIALGVIAIIVILNAGIPLINKMRDRNIVAQTKELMYTFDRNLREVTSEGPGSRRWLAPLEIKKGNLLVDEEDNNLVKWNMETTAELMETDITFQEGTLTLYLNQLPIQDKFLINLELDYGNPFSGRYSLLIEHTGEYSDVNGKLLPDIKIGIK